MWKMYLPIMPSSASTLPVAGDNAAAQVSRSGGGDREHYSSSKCCKYPQDKHFLISLSSRFRRRQFPRSAPLDLALLWQLSKKEKSAFPRIRSWTPQFFRSGTQVKDNQRNVKVKSKRSQTRRHSGYTVSRLLPRPSSLDLVGLPSTTTITTRQTNKHQQQQANKQFSCITTP
jgi:hypothetical protein